jgi:hypothetical protein
VLFHCASLDEAEAETQACAEGLRLASQWCRGPVIVESYSARIVTAMANSGPDRSELRYVVMEAKEYLQLLVKRECNKVVHDLAQLARRNMHTATC